MFGEHKSPLLWHWLIRYAASTESGFISRGHACLWNGLCYLQNGCYRCRYFRYMWTVFFNNVRMAPPAYKLRGEGVNNSIIGRIIMIFYVSLRWIQNSVLYENSARALVKKTQEPGIKLQKADFFRNDTWTSPQTNSEDAPKIPLVHFF